MATDEQLFPIDIHYNKLLDWLVNRRHCEVKWHLQARGVHDRIRIAVGNLPPSRELGELTQREDLNYFHCRQVVELLKSTEGESKNLFGQYNSLILREWSDILKTYEKNNVYLAECAQQLIRNVNYEIPALKQQISKCQQTERDCLRKEGECSASAAAFRGKYDASCKEMGIQGNHVREELAMLVLELPEIFKQVLSELPSVVPAITFYQMFIHHTTGRSPEDSQFLPMLSFVLKKGNVTVYEWKYGEPPPQVVEPVSAQSPTGGLTPGSVNGGQELQIDWGDGEREDSTAPETVTTSNDSQNGGGIDFGETGIDFGDENLNVDLSEIVVEGSGEEIEGGSVTGTQDNGTKHTANLQPLLGHIEARNKFLDDVQELREFLLQRAREMEDEGSSSHFLLQQFSRGLEALGVQSQETIEEMLGHVERMLDTLTSPRTQHLFLIQGSATYLDRLTDSLLQSKQLAGKASSQVQVYASRREEAVTIAVSLEPQLSAIVGQTKELQAQIAADISKRYSNRVVNIMGEINQM